MVVVAMMRDEEILIEVAFKVHLQVICDEVHIFLP